MNKTENPSSDEALALFFISDAPHLINTMMNCWDNMGAFDLLYSIEYYHYTLFVLIA